MRVNEELALFPFGKERAMRKEKAMKGEGNGEKRRTGGKGGEETEEEGEKGGRWKEREQGTGGRDFLAACTQNPETSRFSTLR